MFVGILGMLTACSPHHEITVINTADFDRAEEIIELDAALITDCGKENEIRIIDSNGREIPYQLTFDGKLIFPVDVEKSSSAKYYIRKGKPAPVDTFVFGRLVPERMDDMTWENDKSAYRAYGPALQRSGERAFGYDIWTKSVSRPVINQRYYDHIINNISFHEDHGNGMDVYSVGPTLGGGTAALLNDSGQIVYPYCFKEYEVLDNGPLRFTVRLVYDSGSVDGDTAVTETRLITLDKGSYLNKTEVSYKGLSRPKRIASGIVIHSSNPLGYVFAPEYGYMSYSDLTDNPANDNGIIFIGVVAPDSESFEFMPMESPAGEAIGHILAKKVIQPDEKHTYWWGSGWSKGDIADQDEWIGELQAFANRLKSPLQCSIGRHKSK